jgi:hypothetical protein
MFNLKSVTQDSLKKGVWKDFSGGKFLIASISNFAFQNYYSELRRPFKRKIEQDTLSAEVAQELLCRAMAKFILLDWKDVGEKGSEIPYSVETAFNALNENAELRSFVQEVATDVGAFSAEEEAEDVKS